MQQSCVRFSPALSSHSISTNRSACWYRSWLWRVGSVWVFAVAHRSAAHCGVSGLRRSRAGFWSWHNSSKSAKPRSPLAPGAALLQRSIGTWKAAHVPGPVFISQMWPGAWLWAGHAGTSLLPAASSQTTAFSVTESFLLLSIRGAFFNPEMWNICSLHTLASCFILKTRCGELHCCLLLLCFWLICFSTRTLLWEKINITEKILVCFKHFVSFLCWE